MGLLCKNSLAKNLIWVYDEYVKQECLTNNMKEVVVMNNLNGKHQQLNKTTKISLQNMTMY